MVRSKRALSARILGAELRGHGPGEAGDLGTSWDVRHGLLLLLLLLLHQLLRRFFVLGSS
jgi:hypothetical protein